MSGKLYIHKAYSRSPVVLGDGVYGVLCLVQREGEDVSESTEKYLYFSNDVHAEQIITLINSSFNPIELDVEDDEDDE